MKRATRDAYGTALAKIIQENKNIIGLDAAILMNPETWVASGHVSGFSDPLLDCKECKTRHRADKLIESYAHEKGEDIVADGWTDEQMLKYINDHKIVCPKEQHGNPRKN